MSTTIPLTGAPAPVPPRPGTLERLYGADLGLVVLAEVNLGRAGDAVRDVTLAAGPDDLVELRDAAGLVTVRRVDALLAQGGTGRGAATPAAAVLRAAAMADGLAGAENVRLLRLGLPTEVAAALDELDRLFADVPAGQVPDGAGVAGATAATAVVVEWLDRPAQADDPSWADKPKAPGVYRVGADLRLSAAGPLAEGALAGSAAPVLLLVHGAVAHASAAFTGLGVEGGAAVARRYGDRFLALEHATLGRTPAQNALDATPVLPDGAEVHLLTHGRGGLVGDVLALACAPDAWSGTDRYDAVGHGDHPDVAALRELRRVVVEKGIRVTRHVRVAAPARGTWLASRRPDVFAAHHLLAHRLVPALRDSPGEALAARLLLVVADRRLDPRLVPGLAAMIPSSPFVRWLNTAPPIDDGMAVVAGAVRGAALPAGGRDPGLAAFYRERNDVVVHTRSMSGGVPRRVPRERLVEGADVVHPGYLLREDVRRVVVDLLSGDGPDVAPSEPPVRAADARPRPGGGQGAWSPARDAARATGGVVVLVPDVFGSVLAGPQGRVWPSVASLLGGVAQGLRDDGPFAAQGLTEGYAPLVEALAARYEVREAGYDWTRSGERTAGVVQDALREVVAQARRGSPPRPVHVVAVGAGGLHVVRALQSAADLLDAIRASQGRIVLLSPPAAGSWRVAATLAGRDDLAARLALLDPGHDAAGIGAELALLPGLAELLPDDAPVEGDLPGAGRAFRASLPTAFPATVLYGSGAETIDGWSARDRAFTTTPVGDGQVRADGPPFGGPTFWAPMPFADLVGRPEGLRHLLRLLESGRSEGLLLSAPPQSARPRGFLTTAEPTVDFPGDDDLPPAPAGRRPPTSRTPTRPVRLSVVHGDLTHVDVPILVGTHDGTPIRGALAALDRRFSGALSARAALGRLPGPLGTCDIVTTSDGPGTAVVIGIGDPGDLTPGQLTAGVTNGLLTLILERQERGALGPGEGIAVASALIGTFGGGALTVQASVAAITRGVHQVNRRLLDVAGQVPDTWVESVRIVELFEDRAIEATEAAIRLAAERQPEGAVLVAEHFLADGCGGRPGLPPPDYGSGIWRTIRIGASAEEEDAHSTDALVALSFTSVGRSARAEQRVNRAQRRLVEHLVDEGIDRPVTDPQLYNTLYELMLPNSLKGQGPPTENLMLVVDPAAASVPFELLAARGIEEVPVPLAVATGMMRRLETTTFRESVRPAAGMHALVIGDPSGVAQRLPGAREEARRVAAALRDQGFEVTTVIPESASDTSADVTRIMNALFEHDYRIIHIAAHGTYASDTENGILIGGRILLSAQEIRQMRTTPDLVFLNACHVGSLVLRRGAGAPAGGMPVTNAPGRLAASLARQLIDDGVRGVVAAAWAVDDAAAARFAEVFYDGLLGRLDLGDATRRARTAIYEEFPATNTWGAYQVYGPPALRIQVASSRPAEAPDVVSRKQFRARLADLKDAADDAADAERADLEGRLRSTIDAVPGHWRGGAELDAEAAVWFSLGDYERAIERYGDALREWEGRAPLKLVEQLVNAKVKLARAATGARAHGLFEEARCLVEALRMLGAPTPERLALEGSYLRRRATAATPVDFGLLARAGAAYREADAMYRARHRRSGYYFGINAALLDWAVARHDGREIDVDALLETVGSCEQDAAAQACADFWCRTATADAALATALLTGTVAERAGTVVAAYREVFRAGSSRRERLAIVEHLAILGACLADGPEREAIAGIERDVRTAAPTGAA